jgi:hypothetical protein
MQFLHIEDVLRFSAHRRRYRTRPDQEAFLLC